MTCSTEEGEVFGRTTFSCGTKRLGDSWVLKERRDDVLILSFERVNLVAVKIQKFGFQRA